MPRYEIVAHLVCELGCADAEEAAAIVGHDLAGAPGATLVIQHLAVWRQDPPPAVSPLPAPARQQLLAFFAALARASDAAETAFRGRVAALLTPLLGEMGEGEPTDGSAHSSRDQSADR